MSLAVATNLRDDAGPLPPLQSLDPPTKFTSTAAHVVAEDLAIAVNAAALMQRPLRVKREPGTGRTGSARYVAAWLAMPLIERHVKSTPSAQQRLAEYDAVRRLRISNLGRII